MAGGFQDKRECNSNVAGEQWFGVGIFVSWVVLLEFFYLPVLLKVCVLEMAEHEQLSH